MVPQGNPLVPGFLRLSEIAPQRHDRAGVCFVIFACRNHIATPAPITERFHMGKRKLTTKQKLFIASYSGNGTEAARLAGYKHPRQAAAENMSKIVIRDAIQERETARLNKLIGDRRERQIFWTGIMRDESESIKNRLLASRLLAQSEGDFLIRYDAVIRPTTKPPTAEMLKAIREELI